MTDDARIEPTAGLGEADMLQAFLRYHRDTFRMKIAGLDAAQLNRALPPSAMTLGGMTKHLALVEDSWLSSSLLGRPDAEVWREVDWEADVDWDWHSAVDDAPDYLRDLLDTAIAASEQITAEVLGGDEGLDLRAVRVQRASGEAFTLRWILVHLIEEYARHNGHADLIRESIDGTVGE